MLIDINDLRIKYIDEGEDDGRGVILLLHGWGSNITLFKNIVDMLSPHMRVVAPDMAGFGESDEPKRPWCVDDYVDFIGTFCKKLGITPTVVLGHSFGGRVIIKAVTRKACAYSRKDNTHRQCGYKAEAEHSIKAQNENL